ncbi:MAG: LptF/LptG family permease [Imperialibacter sp.]|uniref:LptF/LptG family permease n=1 Tax=Imperialibacter sp. TaxID=2038411 RepID=UPI0032EE514A
MKLIDKYILKKFLVTFFFVMVMLVSVICVIDFTEKNDKFIKNGLEAAVIFKYYLTVFPFFASLITPITVFIATVFITANMAARTEIIAILASGISFKRMLVPYAIGAILIAILTFFFNGYIIPNANKFRIGFEVAYVKKAFYFVERDIHMKVGDDTYLYLQSYNNSSDVAYKVTLEKIEGDQMKAKLVANRMDWDSTTHKWKVINWQLREIDGFEEKITAGTQLDTALSLSPADFTNNYGRQETMNMNELEEHIQLQTARGAEDVVIYKNEKYIRYMQPFAVIILTFIGVIVSARKSRGGTGYLIALGFALAFLYIIFYTFSRAVAEAGSMDPILAVWLPNIVFGTIGGLMYFTLPR